MALFKIVLRMEMKIDLDNCKLDHSNLNTEEVLALLVDKFARMALDSTKISDTQKCLTVAEKGTRMLEFFERRKMGRALILDEVLSWIEEPIKRSDLYRRYVEACTHRGLIPMSNQELYSQILARGPICLKQKEGGTYFVPTRLK